jgi:D-serine deaminase-like pyridoxal phosphate-dependent protein
LRKYGLAALPVEGGWSEPLPDTYMASLSQEHGVLRTTPAVLATINPGDLIFILPAHSCLTAKAMGTYTTLTGEKIPLMA